MKPLRDMSAALCLTLVAGLASAQVAPPPPPAPAPTAPYVPPAPAPKAPDKPRAPSPAQVEGRAAADAQQKAAAIAFESIAEKDAEGNIKPLPEPVEWYALRKNPIVKPIRHAICEPVLRERRARFEGLVIDNIDIMERFDTGLIDQLDMQDKGRISEIVQLVKPFQSQGTLTNELKKKQALDDVQAAMNQRIINDYIKRKSDEMSQKAGLPAGGLKQGDKNLANNPEAINKVDILTKLMLRTAMSESTYFYEQLLLETGGRLEQLNVDSAEITKYQAATTDDQKIAAVKKLLAPLTLEQKRDLLRRSLGMRPPPPPLPDIEKMKAEAASASGGPEAIVWRGPKGLVEKRIALYNKANASRAMAKEMVAAMEKASSPGATPEDKALVEEVKVKMEALKKDEDEARAAVLQAVKEHPEYKAYLNDAAAKRDGTYFEPEAKAPEAKAPEAKTLETKPADADKK